MPTTQKLCVVADTFFIKERGLVVTTKQWEAGQALRPGDRIELRSGDERHSAQIKSIEMVRFATRDRWVDADNPCPLLLSGISRDAIQAGDEIWSVDWAD